MPGLDRFFVLQDSQYVAFAGSHCFAGFGMCGFEMCAPLPGLLVGQAAFERTGINLNGLKDFYVQAKAIWY